MPLNPGYIFPGRSPAKAGRSAGTDRTIRQAMSLPLVPDGAVRLREK